MAEKGDFRREKRLLRDYFKQLGLRVKIEKAHHSKRGYFRISLANKEPLPKEFVEAMPSDTNFSSSTAGERPKAVNDHIKTIAANLPKPDSPFSASISDDSEKTSERPITNSGNGIASATQSISSEQALVHVKNHRKLIVQSLGELPPIPINCVLGKETMIVLANGETRKAHYAVVNAFDVQASHDRMTFSSNPRYPTDSKGRNLNDRNYAADGRAQLKVREIAEQLNPALLINTSPSPTSTPIITKDGIVVSGNNRVMSLQIAVDYARVGRMDKGYNPSLASKYPAYVQYLRDEQGQFHLPMMMKYTENSLGDMVFSHLEVWATNEKEKKAEAITKFSSPILVRIDWDFPEYTTTELNKYNKSDMKSERPVDRAIRLSKSLREQFRCQSSIGEEVGAFDTLSEFYASRRAEKRVLGFLMSCNVITENEVSAIYDSAVGFNASGKELLEAVLSSIVLEPEALAAITMQGVRKFAGTIITSLSVLTKHASLETNYIEALNEAVLLQKSVYESRLGFIAYITQLSIFDHKPSREAMLLNQLLEAGRRVFKKAFEQYNVLYAQNQGASLFNDHKSPAEIFDFVVTDRIREIFPDAYQAIERVSPLRLRSGDSEETPPSSLSAVEGSAVEGSDEIEDTEEDYAILLSSKANRDRLSPGFLFSGEPPTSRDDAELAKEIEAHWYPVNSLQGAVDIGQEFIAENRLGASNWTGGTITLNDQPIARMSYNGRLWKLTPYGDDTYVPYEDSEENTENNTPNLALPSNSEKAEETPPKSPTSKNLYQKVVDLVKTKGSDRSAYSKEELELLANFEGKGGLAKEGLAEKGILNEFFTPWEIIEAMWGLAVGHGFEKLLEENPSPKVLEPSCGTGRFFKYLNPSVKAVGYEIDSVNATICQLLYPAVEVINAPFETHFFQGKQHLPEAEPEFSLVIGNPPYDRFASRYSAAEKRAVPAVNYHDYFIARGLDLLIPNGLLVMIIPSNFLRAPKAYNPIKEYIHNRGKLLDAYRLPNGIFKNTYVGTDVVVFQKYS